MYYTVQLFILCKSQNMLFLSCWNVLKTFQLVLNEIRKIRFDRQAGSQNQFNVSSQGFTFNACCSTFKSGLFKNFVVALMLFQ